ncbi:twin-arginine translocation signal domain-containing protein [candidate division KSB1 bacterium]|nr:twin-arginine translocation signal domain-containing protein [candidate division KSB1 bacterium]
MENQESKINRRKFLEKSATGTLAAAVFTASSPAIAFSSFSKNKKRVALVGTGSRGSGMWGRQIVEDYSDVAEMVGLYDINKKRAEYAKTYMKTDANIFPDFEKMIKETRPDYVIVATVDSHHWEYAVRAMEMGCDVISEKPVATDEKQCQAIWDAHKKTGKKVIVGFNARHNPRRIEMKELLMADKIGKIISVDFLEYLNVYHGASYFRRWHAYKKNSGTLLVHKSTHHFDQINWWLEADPVEVTAYGQLGHYGKNSDFRGEKCRTCPHKDSCSFYWDITQYEHYMKLYVNCEDVDGYFRDACVFRKDIDIYDAMSVIVKYNNGVQLTYSLNAFLPFEGPAVAFNGTEGRLEKTFEPGEWEKDYSEYRLTMNFEQPQTFKVKRRTGGHGGADIGIKNMIFRGIGDDPYKLHADLRAGIMSAITGIAAYRSIETGKPVKIADLINLT